MRAQSTREQNKEVIRRLMQASDRGDLAAVEALYSPDYVDHLPSTVRSGASSREGLRLIFEAVQRAFPDTQHIIEDLVAEGDRVAARITARGTHTGEFMGVPPSGKLVQQTNIAIYRIVDGRIAERWSYEVVGLLDQLRPARATSS